MRHQSFQPISVVAAAHLTVEVLRVINVTHDAARPRVECHVVTGKVNALPTSCCWRLRARHLSGGRRLHASCGWVAGCSGLQLMLSRRRMILAIVRWQWTQQRWRLRPRASWQVSVNNKLTTRQWRPTHRPHWCLDYWRGIPSNHTTQTTILSSLGFCHVRLYMEHNLLHDSAATMWTRK